MTTGRINQVASLVRRFVYAKRIPSVARAPEWKARGPDTTVRSLIADHETRKRVVAFWSGSALTTSPPASSPGSLRTWASRDFLRRTQGQKTLRSIRFRTARLRHGGRAAGGDAVTVW